MAPIPKTVKLYAADGKFVGELDLPAAFHVPPAVIFYGTRAFLSLLMARGEYRECDCWRAPDPVPLLETAVEVAEQGKMAGKAGPVEPAISTSKGGIVPMQPLNVTTITEAYFGSLKDNRRLHIANEVTATGEEIERDVTLWYAGFTTCARMLENNPTLPAPENVLGVITKNFATRVKAIAA